MSGTNVTELPDFVSEYSELFGAIRKVVPPSMKIYMVGGAVRDILLGRRIRDFDLAVEGLVDPIGKHIANELNGAYYVLDDEREIARVIIDDEEKGQYDIDIALMSGTSIEEDLLDRDFTINAMAISVGAHEEKLIDPLGGLYDIQNGILRMCSPDSIRNDPLRAFRAIRMSLEFDLRLDDELVRAMESVRDQLGGSSFERYRDELFKIIRLNRNAGAVDLCRKYGYLDHLFPGWDNSGEAPDTAWIGNVDRFLMQLTHIHNVEIPADELADYAEKRLGNYRETLLAFFGKTLALYHTRRMLTAFASIAGTLTSSAETVQRWCGRLTFSSSETIFVTLTLQANEYLNSIGPVSGFRDVEIYRYFKQYKEGGIAGLFLFLAGKYDADKSGEAFRDWCECVNLAKELITAYFGRYTEVIAPKPLMSGNDIQALLGLQSGPAIGQIKNALLEAQISGTVRDHAEAQIFIKRYASSARD